MLPEGSWNAWAGPLPLCGAGTTDVDGVDPAGVDSPPRVLVERSDGSPGVGTARVLGVPMDAELVELVVVAPLVVRLPEPPHPPTATMTLNTTTPVAARNPPTGQNPRPGSRSGPG